MPYLILALGILVGLYPLFRFFVNANVHQVKSFLFIASTTAFGLSLLFLAVTGRFLAALVILAACIPLAISYLRHKRLSNGDIIDVTPIEDDDEDDIDDKP